MHNEVPPPPNMRGRGRGGNIRGRGRGRGGFGGNHGGYMNAGEPSATTRGPGSVPGGIPGNPSLLRVGRDLKAGRMLRALGWSINPWRCSILV